MDTASLARIVFDRFNADFSSCLLSGGATALYYPGLDTSGNFDVAGNSAIAFVSISRARGPSTQTNPWTTDTRSAFIGYRIRNGAQNVGAGITGNLPALHRGDGRFTFSVQDNSSGSGNNRATYNVWDVFGAANSKLPNDLTVDPSVADDQRILNWQIIGNAIVRLHITFVLDDGTMVQQLVQTNSTPALNVTYRNFFVNGGTGTCLPLAFSRDTSADANGRYIKGMIVGIAVLDETTRNLAYRIDNNFAVRLASQLQRPISDGQTPLEVWNTNLQGLTSTTPANPNYLFPPVRQNVRCYQQFVAVNL
jgi:hypothetical protein